MSVLPRRMDPPLGPPLGPSVAPSQPIQRGPRKRLFIACTWLDSDNGLQNGADQAPSNVSRICWAIKDTSSDGIPQVVHYQAGVGSMGGRVSRFVGGAVGAGLSDNVREAYTFIAINWRAGDEIFLNGFSRGAWTARSVAGLIGSIGLLTREGLPSFAQIFKDVENRHDPNYRPVKPDVPFPNKPSAADPAYAQELARLGLTRLGVPIKAVAVWETVGSLGIPRIDWLERLGLQSKEMKEYAFYDTSLNENIENAFQALALDEHRGPFAPAVWEKPRGSRTSLTQVWFPGVHSNVGGGYDDADLSNITLAWMISRLEPFIDFRPDYVLLQYDANRTYYRRSDQRPRPWSFGEIHNSLTGIYALAGSKTRTPGAYCRVDPVTGRPTNKLLRNTNEYIHPSVRSRTGLGGPGAQNRGKYVSKALQDWDFLLDNKDEAGVEIKMKFMIWKRRSKSGRGQRIIPESMLLETEKRLLEQSGKVYDYVMEPPPTSRRSRRTSAVGPTRFSGADQARPSAVDPQRSSFAAPPRA